MEEIEKALFNLKSREDFVIFLDALIKDFKTNKSSWENVSLENYLEAIQSWTEDMEGYYQNNYLSIPENISWKVFANILMAAKIYE